MPQSLVHLPDRNIRVLRRKLTRTEIDMMELDLVPAAAGPSGVPALIEPYLYKGELRIRDIDLAVRLEFSTPVNIRKLIRRYSTELARMGVVSTAEITSGTAGGRPGTEFYLNRKQAIFITGKSETDKAADITIEIIERFEAYEQGASPKPTPMTREQIMASALLLADETMKEQAAQIATLTPKAEALDRIADADGALSVTEAAKALQVRPKDLFEFLSTNGWTYRRAGSGTWLGYQTRTNAGDLSHVVMTKLQADGTERVFEQVKVTARGLTKLAKLMPSRVAVAA